MKIKFWDIQHPFQACFSLVNHHKMKVIPYLNIEILLSVNFVLDYKAFDQIHSLPQLSISSLTKNQPVMNSTSVNSGALWALPSALLEFLSCWIMYQYCACIHSGCLSYGQQCWHANQTLIATLHKFISYTFFCFSIFLKDCLDFY